MGIKLDCLGPRNPQRNRKLERKFQTLYGQIRSMLNGAGLQDKIRHGIWAEYAPTANFHSNIMVAKDSMMSPYELCFSKKAHVNKL